MKIVEGSFEKIKPEMEKAKRILAEEIKRLKKKHKAEKVLPSSVQERLDNLAYLENLYSSSKMLPVRIEGIVINYKIFASFMKKLEGLKTSIMVLPDGVVVQYWKQGTLNHGKGVLKLYDLSSYFENFEHVPNAVLTHGQET